MIPWIKQLLWDETAFVRYTRATIAGLGMALHAGVIPVDALKGSAAWWIGPAMITFAFIMGAGEKNEKKPGDS